MKKIFLEYGPANGECIEVSDDCTRIMLPYGNQALNYEIKKTFEIRHGMEIFVPAEIEIPPERLEILNA